MYTPFGHLKSLLPLTTNVGASSGPRVSTAGYEWLEKHKGYLIVRLYADLDGSLWQDDFDVLRRGAQAIVPFAQRASKMIKGDAAAITSEPIKNQPERFRTTLTCHDEVEGYERRVFAQVDFPLEDARLLDDVERQWVERFDKIVVTMGKGLHVGLNDPRNRRLLYSSDAA